MKRFLFLLWLISVLSGIAIGQGNPSFSITLTVTGSEKWSYPRYDAATGTWVQESMVHDITNDLWYRNGVLFEGGVDPIGWNGAPSGSTGLDVRSTNFKFKIQSLTTPHPSAVWVKAYSKSLARFGEAWSVLKATNGLGDSETFTHPFEKTTSGFHLRKVKLDEEGIGYYTVKNYAEARGSGSQASFSATTSAILEIDPRVVILPTNFLRDVQTTETDFSANYMTLTGQHVFSESGLLKGRMPVGEIGTDTITYKNATRKVNEPLSTDALTLQLNAIVGVDPVKIVHDASGTDGTEYRELTYWSSFGNATEQSMRPTHMVGYYNQTYRDKASEQVSDDLDIVSLVMADVIEKYYNIFINNLYKVEKERGQETGYYNSQFYWNDSVVGKTSVAISYMSKSVPLSTPTKKRTSIHQPESNAMTLFKYTSEWEGYLYPSSIVYETGHQNYVDSFALATGAMAVFTAIEPGLMPVTVVMSAVNAGLSAYLDSDTDFNNVTKTFSTANFSPSNSYWLLLDADQIDLEAIGHGEETFVDILDECWFKVKVAPKAELTLEVLDFYNESGFVSRNGSKRFEYVDLSSGNPQIDVFWMFEYANSGGGLP